MAHEIVQYHNDMASVSLSGFSPTDLNVFSAVLYSSKGKGTKKYAIFIDDLKELSGYSSKDNKRFMNYLDELTDKMMDLKYKSRDAGGGFEKFRLFPSFKTITDDETGREALLVGVSEELAYILNVEPEYVPDGVKGLLEGGYTKYELGQHNSLNSVYSKNAFRQLKRFERTGWWRVDIDEFRRLLDVPESYRLSDLRRRVLGPIREELPQYFRNLNIEEIKGKNKEGRKTTVALHFTFDKKTEKGVWYEDETRNPLDERYKCPLCGETLYEIVKKDGSGDVFYGHREGWKSTAKCKQTFSSLEEILGLNGDVDQGGGDSPNENKPKSKMTGFRCRECGRPLYELYNDKNEMFYGHIDGWKPNAICSQTYSSVAEIRGYSETPTREEHFDLYDKDDVDGIRPDGAAGVYETIKNIMDNKRKSQEDDQK